MVAAQARYRRYALPAWATVLACNLIASQAYTATGETTVGRVVLAAPAQSVPPSETLAAALSLELSRSGILIVVEARPGDRLAINEAEIEKLADEEAQREPGLIAAIGYGCGLTHCRVILVEPRSKTSFEIQVPADPQQVSATTASLAGTLREALIGPLLPEMERLAEEAASAGPPLPSRLANAPLSPTADDAQSKKTVGAAVWPWLVPEVEYHGAYMGSSNSLLHGPLIGVSMHARSYAAMALSLGWLGLDRMTGSPGVVEIHRLVTTVAARFSLELGPAELVLAPVLRIDAVYATFFPRSLSSSQRTDMDLLGGLEVLWCLPLPLDRLGLVLGAGLFGSIIAHSFTIDDIVVAERPPFAVTWRAGVSYGLPRPF